MFSHWIVVFLALTAIAVLYSLLLTLQGWECRRYVRSRLACQLDRDGPTANRLAVLAPCKGADRDEQKNLRRLFDQDYGHYAIIFIVESEDDPAAAVIRRLIADHPHVSAHLFVAGRAHGSGQKVHNLAAAAEGLSEHFEILAFTDADARHNSNWLRALVEHLYIPGVGASTGYRWLVPRRATLPNLLLYSINSSVAGLFGRSIANFIWGGSWAIQRQVFERLKLQTAWRGTLSDDMVARRVLREAGLRVVFEPRCVAASPTDVTLAQMIEFLRRQYLIGRRYAPYAWLAALGANGLTQGAAWGNLCAGVYGLITGWSGWWLPAVCWAVLYGLNVARAWLRQDVGRRMLPTCAPHLAAARRFDIWAGPLVGLVNLAAMLTALVGDTIVWRGNRYRIAPGGFVRLLGGEASAGLDDSPQEVACRIEIFPVAATDERRAGTGGRRDRHTCDPSQTDKNRLRRSA